MANIMYDAAKSRADAFEGRTKATEDPVQTRIKSREIHDTVDLSKNGQKMVNLNNSTVLAKFFQLLTDSPFTISTLF